MSFKKIIKDSGIKLAVFDFDGTLIVPKDGSDSLVYHYINSGIPIKAIQDEINHLNSIHPSKVYPEIVDLYNRSDVDEDYIANVTLKRMKRTKGAAQFIRKLEKSGVKVAIVSGGLSNIFDIMYKGMDVDYKYFSINFMFDNEGKIADCSIRNATYDGKVLATKEIIEKNDSSFDFNNVLFIGDGYNDIPLMKKVKYSFSVTKNEAVKKEAKFNVDPGSNLKSCVVKYLKKELRNNEQDK